MGLTPVSTINGLWSMTGLVDAWLTALIAVAGTLAGSVVGVRGALAISRQERRDALRAEIRRAFAAYLGALYPVVAELRDMPAMPSPRLLDVWTDRLRGEAATWVLTRKRLRRALGDRPRELMDRLALAAAQLQVLPLPPEMRSAFDAANEYAERLAKRRSPAIKAEWPAVYGRLMAAAEALAPTDDQRSLRQHLKAIGRTWRTPAAGSDEALDGTTSARASSSHPDRVGAGS